MPTYNYYCSECDAHFSYFQKMSETPISSCENCGGELNRLITGGTGLIFKGSGFYLTDYKNDQQTTEDSSDNKKKNENHQSIDKEKNDATTGSSLQKKEKKQLSPQVFWTISGLFLRMLNTAYFHKPK